MEQKKRITGLDLVGDVPWGTHFCLFYQTAADLIDILVPYFAAGLKNNELCMWVCSEPLLSKDAKTSLRKAVRNLDAYIESGQIEILDWNQWYTESGKFEADRVLRGWLRKENQAVKGGFDGLRLTGNTSWLEPSDWAAFTQYEATVDRVIGQQRILALCTYSLDRCGAAEIMDVVANHGLGLVERKGRWAIIESEERKRAEGYEKLNAEVLARVSQPGGTRETIPDLLLLIKEGTEFEAVGVRLRGGDDFPYFQTDGFPAEFVEAERYLCARDQAGELIRDSQGNPYLECMCGNVVCQRTNPALPFFTAGGSFWTNSTTELLGSTTEADRQARTRNRCNGEGYESVALIPLRAGSEVIGLLQLNDRRKGRLTAELVAHLERVGASIGIALTRQRMEEALLEGKDRLRTVVEASLDAIIAVNSEGRIVLFNGAAQELFQYSEAEALNQPASILVREEIGGIHQQRLERFLSRGVGQCGHIGKRMEKTFRSKGGSLFEGEVSMSGGRLDGLRLVVLTIHDITERKRAEEALRKSEARMRNLFDHQVVGVAITSLEKGWLEVNDTWCQMLGYSREELAQMTWAEVTHPEDLAADVAQFNRLVSGEVNQYSLEKRFIRKNGAVIFTEISVGCVRRPDGSADYIVGLATDITERKRAEEALRASESELRALLAAMTDVILVLDSEGRYIKIASTSPALLYKPAAQLVGKTLDAVFPEPQAAAFLAAIRRAVETRQTASLDYSLPIGGEEKWFAARVSPMLDNAVVWVARDITESKQAEAALRSSEMAFRELAESIGDVFFAMDRDLKYTYWNNASEALTGIAARDVVGKSLYDIFPDIKGTAQEGLYLQVLATQRPGTVAAEYRTRGEYRFFEISAYPSRRGLSVFAGDITERKRAEAALRESEQRYRTLFESVNVPIVVFQPEDETIVEANKPACDVYGFSREELIGMSLKRLTKHPERGEREIEQILRDGHSFNFESVHLDREGKPIDMLINSSVIDYGGREMILSVNRDISQVKEAERKLRQLSGRLLQAQDQERRRIARELHDVTAQNLTALAMNLSLLLETPGNVDAQKLLADSLSLARRSLDETRSVSYLLHPPLLDELGLAEALGVYTAGFSQRTGIQVNLRVQPKFPRLPAELETTVFRIVQESLSNVHRHSGSPTADISIGSAEGAVRLEVQDQGCGLQSPRASADAGRAAELGVGITGMRERARQLGGRLEIESGGRGVTVRAILPISEEES